VVSRLLVDRFRGIAGWLGETAGLCRHPPVKLIMGGDALYVRHPLLSGCHLFYNARSRPLLPHPPKHGLIIHIPQRPSSNTVTASPPPYSPTGAATSTAEAKQFAPEQPGTSEKSDAIDDEVWTNGDFEVISSDGVRLQMPSYLILGAA
jgi:hypothetical protein